MRGFTLLETLIAAGVLGLLMSAVYGSYRAVTSSLAGLQPRIALDQEGRFFVQRLSRQIRCCYGGPGDRGRRSPSNPHETRPTVSEEKGMRLFWGGSTSADDIVLQFVTTSSGLSRRSSPGCLTLVSYKVDPGSQVLLASEELYGRRGQEDDKDWRAVLEGLQEIEFRYFDGVDWQAQWDASRAGSLPKAVRIKLVLQPERGDLARCFTAVVPIRCSTPRKLEAEVQGPAITEKSREK